MVPNTEDWQLDGNGRRSKVETWRTELFPNLKPDLKLDDLLPQARQSRSAVQSGCRNWWNPSPRWVVCVSRPMIDVEAQAQAIAIAIAVAIHTQR